MRCLIVLSALAAVAIAAPGFIAPGFAAPHFYSGYAVAPVSSQYLAQDSLGQYSYGYSGGASAKSESRAYDGSVAGGYSFVDEKGEVQNVQYTADAANGFRVAASNLPVGPAPVAVETPVPVKDTFEVAQARAEHLAAVDEVKNRKVDEYVTPVVAYSAPAYNYPAYQYGAYAAPAYNQYTASSYAYNAPAFYASKTFAYPEAKTFAYSAYPEAKTFAYSAYPEAKTFAYAAPTFSYAAAPVAPVTSQYHAQDELGQYSYGYSGGLSAKTETKSFDGVTRGGYSYVDANNEVQHVQYTADDVNGFRVAATNLPVASGASHVYTPVNTIVDTPEVAAAKSVHFAAHVEAKERFAKAL